jgi:hypothetical protein
VGDCPRVKCPRHMVWGTIPRDQRCWRERDRPRRDTRRQMTVYLGLVLAVVGTVVLTLVLLVAGSVDVGAEVVTFGVVVGTSRW